MPEKVSVVTLGCEHNLVDSEIMSDPVHHRGFKPADKPEDATVAIVNTCGFIDAVTAKHVGRTLDAGVERYDARSDVFVGRSRLDAPEAGGEVSIAGCRAEIRVIRRVPITHACEYDLSGEGIA